MCLCSTIHEILHEIYIEYESKEQGSVRVPVGFEVQIVAKGSSIGDTSGVENAGETIEEGAPTEVGEVLNDEATEALGCAINLCF